MNIGELVMEIFFDANTIKLHDFIHAVGELNMSSVASALGLGTLYEATNKIMNMADNTTNSIYDFNKSTGLGTKEAQQFGDALEQVAGTADEARSSFSRLQTNIAQVKLGRGNIEPFTVMGLNIGKSTLDVMKQIQKFLKESPMDLEYKKMMALEAGISENAMIALMNMDDLTEAMKKQDVNSDRQIEKMHEFHLVNKKMGQELSLIWVDIASAIEPVIALIEKVVTAFTEGMHKLLSSRTEFAKGIGLAGLSSAFPGLSSMLNIPIKPIQALAGAGAAASNEVNNDINVNISGVSDPREAAEQAVKAIGKMLTDRFYHEATQTR